MTPVMLLLDLPRKKTGNIGFHLPVQGTQQILPASQQEPAPVSSPAAQEGLQSHATSS